MEHELKYDIENEIVEATSGKVIVRKSEEGIYFKEESRLYSNIETKSEKQNCVKIKNIAHLRENA